MLKLLTLILLSALFLLLSSCTAPIKHPKLPAQEPAIQKPFKIITERLERNILKAQKNENWLQFVDLSQTLWHKVYDSTQQAHIENRIYTQLKQLDSAEQFHLMQLAETKKNIALQDWMTLIQIRQQPPIWQKIQLSDLKTFHETAIYHRHLLPELIANLNQQQISLQQIGVLLPFSEPYAKIAKQIRNGILKNQLHNQKDIIIKFYDSSNLDQLPLIYQQAVDEGAEHIIGPLRRESIALLAKHQAQNLTVLNRVENTPFTQFSFNSLSESLQIVNKLDHLQHKNIAILSNDSNRNITTAQEIHKIWNQKTPNHHASFKHYSTSNAKLRETLASLINEPQSVERRNNLRRVLGQNLTFTSRPRQDLDAILMLDNARNIAVFKPQLKFFGLNTPVFATSNLSPSNFKQPKLYPDLEGVIFPTSTASVCSQNTSNNFEAFGWDSLTIASNPNNVVEGLCTKGQKGRLTRLNNNIIDTHLLWATFDRTGRIVPLR